MTQPLHELVASLPTSSVTTRLLGALDYVVPGEWKNLTDLTDFVKDVTGETDEALIQQVGERAIQLYNDPEQGYQRAVQIYRLVDDTQGISGIASLANKLSGEFDFLSFLGEVTPKADVTQAIDAGIKLVAELTAYCFVNGMPGDSIGDFAAAFGGAQKEDAIRLAAFLSFDCVLPLGPDFLAKLSETIEGASDDLLSSNGRFGKILSYLPGGAVGSGKELVQKNFAATKGTLEGFVKDKGIDQQTLLAKAQGVLGDVGSKLDYVAAGIDLVSNHFEHTGIQTVARKVVARAYGEI